MTEKNRNSNYYDYHNNDKNSYNNKYNNNNNNYYNTNSNEYLKSINYNHQNNQNDQGHDINSDKIKNGDIYNDENNNNDNNNYENSDFVSASNGDQNNFYDFYGNQNYGKYENNPLLNIFDSSSTSIMPFTRNLDFDLEHDDDHPMYANYIDRHGQIDATNNPYYSKEMERRSINSLPDKLEIEEKSDKKGPAWVEGLLRNLPQQHLSFHFSLNLDLNFHCQQNYFCYFPLNILLYHSNRHNFYFEYSFHFYLSFPQDRKSVV